jgi:hypothetical protein
VPAVLCSARPTSATCVASDATRRDSALASLLLVEVAAAAAGARKPPQQQQVKAVQQVHQAISLLDTAAELCSRCKQTFSGG